MIYFFHELWEDLYCRASVAYHSDVLAGKIVLCVPDGTVAEVALEVVQSRDTGPTPVREETGSRYQHITFIVDDSFVVADLKLPFPLLLVKDRTLYSM